MTALRLTAIAIAALALSALATAAPGGGPQSRPGGSDTAQPKGQPSSAPAVQPAKSDYERAEYLIKSGLYTEAMTLLQHILVDNPNDADTLNYLGFANRKTGNTKEALGYYEKALAIDPDHKGAHAYLGELYLQMNDVAKAKEQLAEVKRICVTNCEEAEDLAADIADYKAAHPDAAAKPK